MKRLHPRMLIWAVPVMAAVCWLAFADGTDGNNEPRRVVPVDAELDLGPYAGTALRDYRVRAGDTLSHIALREIGSVQHVSTLKRWNPRVKATALRVGQTLRLPPMPKTEGPEPHAFFVWRLDDLGRGHLQSVGPDARLRDLEHGFVLLAAPLSLAADAEREWRDAEAFSAPLPRVPGTSASRVLAKTPGVPSEDLTERVLQHVSISSIVGGVIRTARSTQPLDGKGRTIQPLSVQTHEWATLLITVLGLLGGALLLFVGARRLELAHE